MKIKQVSESGGTRYRFVNGEGQEVEGELRELKNRRLSEPSRWQKVRIFVCMDGRKDTEAGGRRRRRARRGREEREVREENKEGKEDEEENPKEKRKFLTGIAIFR